MLYTYFEEEPSGFCWMHSGVFSALYFKSFIEEYILLQYESETTMRKASQYHTCSSHGFQYKYPTSTTAYIGTASPVSLSFPWALTFFFIMIEEVKNHL